MYLECIVIIIMQMYKWLFILMDIAIYIAIFRALCLEK